MHAWVYASLIVFFASALQSITGFGFAIMATPFLLMFYNSQDCVQISTMLSFIIAMLLTPRIKQHIDRNILKRLIVGGVLGIPVGVLFFAYASLSTLKLAIGIVILLITSYSLLKRYIGYFRFRRSGFIMDNEATRSKSTSTGELKFKELIVGFFAGALTTSVSMPGVPMALYFNNGSFKKEVIRSTTLGLFIVVYITGMITQFVTVGISSQVLKQSLYLSPAVLLGIVVGNLLFEKINRDMFFLITNYVLLYMGIFILFKA